MVGFLAAALIITYFGDYFTWSFAIQLQAICEVPIAIGYLITDNAKVDVLHTTKKPRIVPVNIV